MKFKIFSILAFVCALLITANILKAADTTNIDISAKDLGDRVMFYGQLRNGTSPEDNAFSKAIDIQGLRPEGGVLMVRGLTIANRDVNFFILGTTTEDEKTPEFDDFQSFITRSALDDVDAAGTTPVFVDPAKVLTSSTVVGDTSQYFVDDLAFRGTHILMQADGQTSNPAGSITYWYLILNKDARWHQMHPSTYKNQSDRVKSTD